LKKKKKEEEERISRKGGKKRRTESPPNHDERKRKGEKREYPLPFLNSSYLKEKKREMTRRKRGENRNDYLL